MTMVMIVVSFSLFEQMQRQYLQTSRNSLLNNFNVPMIYDHLPIHLTPQGRNQSIALAGLDSQTRKKLDRGRQNRP